MTCQAHWGSGAECLCRPAYRQGPEIETRRPAVFGHRAARKGPHVAARPDRMVSRRRVG